MKGGSFQVPLLTQSLPPQTGDLQDSWTAEAQGIQAWILAEPTSDLNRLVRIRRTNQRRRGQELRCSMKLDFLSSERVIGTWITQVLIQELAIQYGSPLYQQCSTHPSCFSKLQMQRCQHECDVTPVSPGTYFWGGHARWVVTKKNRELL